MHDLPRQWTRNEFVISTDRSKLDLDLVHGYLASSYWASGMPRPTLERAVENSLTFGIYRGDQQAGFARVITDLATYAYLSDVFVVEPYRGRGLSKWLMEVIIAHPKLQGFRRWVLSTKDAHELYARFGFIKLYRPERWMERLDPNLKESPDYWQR